MFTYFKLKSTLSQQLYLILILSAFFDCSRTLGCSKGCFYECLNPWGSMKVHEGYVHFTPATNGPDAVLNRGDLSHETAAKRNVYIRVFISCFAKRFLAYRKRFRASWSRNLRTRALAPTLPQSVMFLGDRKRLLSCNRTQVNQFDFSAEVSAKSFTHFSFCNKSSFHWMLHCLDFSTLTDITRVHRSVGIKHSI